MITGLMKTFSWINVVLGLWLIVAAFIFTYTSGHRMVTTEEVVMGLLIAGLACWSAISRPNPLLSVAVAILGLVTLIESKSIDYDGLATARYNNAVVGFAVLVLGTAGAIASMISRAREHAKLRA